MEKTKFLILGAGPAGLTFANLIKQYTNYTFTVLEKEATPGGLCRSEDVDGSPLDIGGGHFLDVRRPKVNDYLFSFMPREEWNLFERDSRIDLDDFVINHPLEANIWQMPEKEQELYLESIAEAGCNKGEPIPEDFVDWIYWKLGKRIADKYMLPYNSKMFGGELKSLGTYWLEKLPNVSYEETKLSCENKKAYGTQPGHASFLYPVKYGYGELWSRMGKELGENLQLNKSVVSLNVKDRIVKCKDGSLYGADYIINTVPWNSIEAYVDCDLRIIDCIHKLKHTGTEIRYIPETLNTTAQWIYVPNLEVKHHRILVRSNFCSNSKGYWLETNMNRVEDENEYSYKNEYTYPLNTKDKPANIKKILDYMKCQNIIGLGRWGEHEHYNSDKTVERAMEEFDRLVFEKENNE